MKYKVFRLHFPAGVHFGKGRLEDTAYTFKADTLFSALCIEAVKDGEERLLKLVEYAKQGKLIISDGLPYIGNEYYIPKPVCNINMKEVEEASDSSVKKLYKKIEYIPVGYIEDYMSGDFPSYIAQEFDNFGKKYVKVSAFVNGEEDTMPYRVGQYYYNENNGLYVIAQAENKDILDEFEKLLISTGLSGIGGERSSGLGRFEVEHADESDVSELIDGLNKESGEYITLSVSLPKDGELENVLKDAEYRIIKRSGFVASYSCNKNNRDTRKRDLYVLEAGAWVHQRYEGDVYDVSEPGNSTHAVYRYAKPMFLSVR